LRPYSFPFLLCSRNIRFKGKTFLIIAYGFHLRARIQEFDDVAGLRETAYALGSELELTKTEVEITEDALRQTVAEKIHLKRSLEEEQEKVKKLRVEKKNEHDNLHYHKSMTLKVREKMKEAKNSLESKREEGSEELEDMKR
jgi:septal ring factor EnvC (AmiA/AmiB activator)